MFRLVLFALGLSFFVCSGTPKCLELRFVGVLDCSGLMLNDTKELPTMKDSWVKRLDLRMNRFVSINFTRIVLAYPGLQVVDVRGNVGFDCQISPGLKISITSTCNPGSVISLPSLASSIQFLLPPTSTQGMSSTSPSQLPLTSTHGMSSTTPSQLPPTSMHGVSSTTPSQQPPTSTHGMSLTTPSQLLPTSTHGMSSTTQFSRFYTSSSIQNQTTTSTYLGKSRNLLFLLIVIIAPSTGLIAMLVCIRIYTRRMVARRRRRALQHEHPNSQIELLAFRSCESSESVATYTGL